MRCCILICLLTVTVQGCATARLDRHSRQALAVLESRTDADSLAAAAMLVPWVEPRPNADTARSLLMRAAAAAPERADLAWLNIQLCRDVPACDAEPEVERLRTLDPTNGAGWLNAVARAYASDDESAKIAALSGLAGAQRVDIYWTTLIVHLTRALADSGKVSLQQALVSVIGALGAWAVPPYSPTTSLCKGPRLDNDEALQDCRRIALAFEHGDTFITEAIGLIIAKRAWAADSPEWNAAAEEQGVMRYRMQVGAHAEAELGIDAQWAREYLSLCEQNRREQDVVLAEIVKAGKNPDPPPGRVSGID